MKLTKAQRLFVEVGKAQASMEYYKWCENQSLFDDDEDDDVILVTENRNIAKYRKLRKKLIREALEAWQEEEKIAYDEGMGLAMRAFRKWMGDAAQYINNTTKTQHT